MEPIVFAYMVQRRDGYDEVASSEEFGALRTWMIENTMRGDLVIIRLAVV